MNPYTTPLPGEIDIASLVPDVQAPGRQYGDMHQASLHPGDRIARGANVAGPVPVERPCGHEFTSIAPGEKR